MYSRSKLDQKETPINSNTNYLREMKLLPINMEYCLLESEALNFFLGFRLDGGSLLNVNSFNVNPKIRHGNYKVHRSNCLDTKFHNISHISLRVIWFKNYN